MSASERLALAADLPLPEAQALYTQISRHFGVVKVGLSLFVEQGPRAVTSFTERGAKVFLDLKLHDIPNTVELAAARAGALGVSYLTVHAAGGEAMLRAAVSGAAEGAAKAGKPAPVVLAVTVLTSLSAELLPTVGVAGALEAQVERLARLAKAAGVGGVVCSVHEAKLVREVFGAKAVVCTPGIRPSGTAVGDQARVATPAEAIAAGASLLVVGRPVSEAMHPAPVAEAIASEVEAAVRGE